MDNLSSILREIDPDEISKLNSKKKPKARKELIKKFVIKSYRNNYKDIEKKRDLMVLKNLMNFAKFLFPIYFFFNFVFYKFLLTGVYEYKSIYYNVSQVPFIFKLGISSYLSYLIFKQYWLNYAYNQEVYTMAVNDLIKIKNNTNV